MEFLGTEKCFTWMDDDNSNQPGEHNGRFAQYLGNSCNLRSSLMMHAI